MNKNEDYPLKSTVGTTFVIGVIAAYLPEKITNAQYYGSGVAVLTSSLISFQYWMLKFAPLVTKWYQTYQIKRRLLGYLNDPNIQDQHKKVVKEKYSEAETDKTIRELEQLAGSL